MAESCGIKKLSVIVKSCRSPYDFIFSVTIYVSHRQIVVSIGKQSVAAAATCGCGRCDLGRFLHIGIHHAPLCPGVRTMQPAVFKLRAIKVNCPDICITIVSSTENSTRISFLSSQISYCCQVSVSSVVTVSVGFPFCPVESSISFA